MIHAWRMSLALVVYLWCAFAFLLLHLLDDTRKLIVSGGEWLTFGFGMREAQIYAKILV